MKKTWKKSPLEGKSDGELVEMGSRPLDAQGALPAFIKIIRQFKNAANTASWALFAITVAILAQTGVLAMNAR